MTYSNEQEIHVSFTKIDRNIPDDFLQARENEINDYIDRLISVRSEFSLALNG